MCIYCMEIYNSNSVSCSESTQNIFCLTAFLSGKNWYNTHHTSDNTTLDLSCLVVTLTVVSPPFKTKQSVWSVWVWFEPTLMYVFYFKLCHCQCQIKFINSLQTLIKLRTLIYTHYMCIQNFKTENIQGLITKIKFTICYQ